MRLTIFRILQGFEHLRARGEWTGGRSGICRGCQPRERQPSIAAPLTPFCGGGRERSIPVARPGSGSVQVQEPFGGRRGVARWMSRCTMLRTTGCTRKKVHASGQKLDRKLSELPCLDSVRLLRGARDLSPRPPGMWGSDSAITAPSALSPSRPISTPTHLSVWTLEMQLPKTKHPPPPSTAPATTTPFRRVIRPRIAPNRPATMTA